LNDSDLELRCDSGAAGKVANEGSSQSGDAVTVEESENVALVAEVVDQTVGITVQ
jgi:hypothetical protein